MTEDLRGPDCVDLGGCWMFVQVINGRVVDAGAVKALGDRWYAELRAGADGWLGSAGGVTADGERVILARFESADAARANSDRTDQGQWWAEAQKCFSGEVQFADFDDVILPRGGGSDEAGFVQVILGTTSNPARDRKLAKAFESTSGDFRPDLLGGIVGINDDGRFAQAFYFTSETEARAGERQEMPEQLRQGFTESQAMTTDIRFLDLTDPWLYSPR